MFCLLALPLGENIEHRHVEVLTPGDTATLTWSQSTDVTDTVTVHATGLQTRDLRVVNGQIPAHQSQGKFNEIIGKEKIGACDNFIVWLK